MTRRTISDRSSSEMSNEAEAPPGAVGIDHSWCFNQPHLIELPRGFYLLLV